MNVSKANQHGVIITPHALRVVPDYLFELGAFFADHQGLVHLFLALSDVELGIGVIDNVLDLVHQAVLKHPYTDRAGTHGRHLGPESLGAVVTDHDHLVFSFQAKRHHTEAEVFDIF